MGYKYHMSFIILLIVVSSCTGESKKAGGTPENTDARAGESVIEFKTETNDIGRVLEGEKVVTWFDYENTGDRPLLLKDIKAGCGCTVPSYSKEPLSPGESGTIKVIFDSSGKKGIQNIGITVYSNSRSQVSKLSLKGVVESI
ncbi:MAG: DUF1573 domain-containing protein [Bacteroidales bacterium]|nr:DUF1573 domain-containing protein [Bacteroidales bacterium]